MLPGCLKVRTYDPKLRLSRAAPVASFQMKLADDSITLDSSIAGLQLQLHSAAVEEAARLLKAFSYLQRETACPEVSKCAHGRPHLMRIDSTCQINGICCYKAAYVLSLSVSCPLVACISCAHILSTDMFPTSMSSAQISGQWSNGV